VDIEIFDSKSQCIIGVFKISIRGENYQPTINEAYEEAWKCALDDGIADPTRKSDYSYRAL
jgi:hypothetical protein